MEKIIEHNKSPSFLIYVKGKKHKNLLHSKSQKIVDLISKSDAPQKTFQQEEIIIIFSNYM